MIASARWQSNWRVVARPGALCLHAGLATTGRRAATRRASALAPGTPVVLLVTGPGAIHRCRVFAARAGVELDREYLAFPSATRPGFLVEDTPTAATVFLDTLPAPPRPLLGRVAEVVLSAVSKLGPWRLLRHLSPGRVAVGRRV